MGLGQAISPARPAPCVETPVTTLSTDTNQTLAPIERMTTSVIQQKPDR
jgi:hypothetical protein